MQKRLKNKLTNAIITLVVLSILAGVIIFEFQTIGGLIEIIKINSIENTFIFVWLSVLTVILLVKIIRDER